MTHNHPSGSSLSPGDFEAFIEHELNEIRAVCPEGSVFSLKNLGGRISKEEFKNIKRAVKKVIDGYPSNIEPHFIDRVKTDQYMGELMERFGDNIQYHHYKPI